MCSCNEIIMVSVSCLAATMTKSTTGSGTGCPLIHHWTQRSTLMGQMTLGPCPLEVSLGIKYKLLRVGSNSVLGKGALWTVQGVEDHRQACAWSVVLATNALKH